jgi:hypothetical protein
MRKKKKCSDKSHIVKTCAFCGDVFSAKRKSAVYCSDSCKVKFHIRKTTRPQWYEVDPNEGKKLPPGTVTSWNMPEDRLIFFGNKDQLYQELRKYLSELQLIEERQNIISLLPFSKTNDWFDSSTQILTNENMMEVFRTLPDLYKLYLWPWGDDNEKPFE